MDTIDPSAILSEMSERDRRVAIGYPREPQDVPRLIGAVRAVLGEHQEDARETGWCAGCGFTWPCSTVRAVTAALTGEENDGG